MKKSYEQLEQENAALRAKLGALQAETIPPLVQALAEMPPAPYAPPQELLFDMNFCLFRQDDFIWFAPGLTLIVFYSAPCWRYIIHQQGGQSYPLTATTDAEFKAELTKLGWRP